MIQLNIKDFPDAKMTQKPSYAFCREVPTARYSHPDFTHFNPTINHVVDEVIVFPNGNIFMFSWMTEMNAYKNVANVVLGL